MRVHVRTLQHKYVQLYILVIYTYTIKRKSNIQLNQVNYMYMEITITIKCTHIIGYIVSHPLAKHRSDQFAIHLSGIEILVFRVEEQSRATRTNEVSERLAHHSKAKHVPVLCEVCVCREKVNTYWKTDSDY